MHRPEPTTAHSPSPLAYTHPLLQAAEPLDLVKNAAIRRKGVLSLEKENIVFETVPVGQVNITKVRGRNVATIFV